ncbi:prepilin-type N-terminal cleavage/methylation domain-containing protein [Undibacterium piscinae]|jgi:type IV fimbrial biogenesis protein FimT|uniref:Type II secretion system protein H n=1 Tax=Undibacterium piscinae TaxID=2495591 RepID=A0A6M4ABF3_9BURK|nr:prepilin-type N-terminal cleavage/methylation domain-containing protein [Undibacterium piscinae]
MKNTGHRVLLRKYVTGFTLIELMMTLSISVVLLAIGVPSMRDLIRDARLSSQADLLVRTINAARMEAIKQRSNFKVCPASTPNSATACSALVTDWTNGWVLISGTTISQRILGKSGVTITTAATGVEFGATLGTPTAASSFVLCVSGRKQQTVNVSASGHVDKRIDSTVCS